MDWWIHFTVEGLTGISASHYGLFLCGILHVLSFYSVNVTGLCFTLTSCRNGFTIYYSGGLDTALGKGIQLQIILLLFLTPSSVLSTVIESVACVLLQTEHPPFPLPFAYSGFYPSPRWLGSRNKPARAWNVKLKLNKKVGTISSYQWNNCPKFNGVKVMWNCVSEIRMQF